ncbi:MAG: hypothetical protein HY711_06655 [Candidatus Melainabacteria bacterium]|nr:hypothetical protein [Candidatus Melainabacteria bacterium]
MSIETAARRIEREAQQNPEAAAQSMNLLTDVQQNRLLAQIRRDAQQAGTSFHFDRDPKTGEITAIEFGPVNSMINKSNPSSSKTIEDIKTSR